MRKNALDKPLLQMAKDGFYQLDYSAVYGNKIRNLCKIQGAESHIEDIVFFLFSELANYLTSRDIVPFEIRSFAKNIIAKLGGVLTISSIAHFIHMVQMAEYPFTDEIRGFDKRNIIIMLQRYIEKQNEWRLEKEKMVADENGETVCIAERERLIADALKKNPELKNKIIDLRRKLEARFPANDNRTGLQKLRDLHDKQNQLLNEG